MICPGELAATIGRLYGTNGDAWAAGLPGLVQRCAERWSLTIGVVGAPANYAFVVEARQADGARAIIKLAYPGRELHTEIDALGLFDGVGAVRLLADDPNDGALLLERLEPGTPLSNVADDAEATAIAAEVMRRLWRPAPAGHSFPTVAEWFGGLARYRARLHGVTGPIQEHLIRRAESLFGDLLESSPPGEPMLLHGDLHHDNVLLDRERGWLAIDPKGVVGDPAFEAAALLRNPWRGAWAAVDPVAVLRARVDVLCAVTGLDPRRIVSWAVASAVLSACWSVEDHEDGWDWSTECAGWLTELLGTMD